MDSGPLQVLDLVDMIGAGAVAIYVIDLGVAAWASWRDRWERWDAWDFWFYMPVFVGCCVTAGLMQIVQEPRGRASVPLGVGYIGCALFYLRRWFAFHRARLRRLFDRE
jgi:hypothetical protein